MPPSKLYPKLSKDLENLLESGYNHDVIIQIGEESTSNEIKEFKVHSLLLGTRSLYFRSALSNHWAIKKDGMITFKKPNISPKIFEIIIRYIYTGEIDLEQQENTEIIKILHAILIENWISKKDDDDILPSFRFTSLTSAPTFSFYPSSSQNQNQKLHYEWHLLYRASRDDFSAESFHAKCDNQGACVVAIKVKDQSIILGGYNPIGWFSSSGSPSSTDSSFIYYLDLNMFPLNFKLSRVLPNKTYQAIYQSSKYGPIFGAAELCIYSNCDKVKGSKCLTHNIYEQNILFGEFCVEDYEVFKVNVD
ncbi:unnamed protein product [Rhizophagus irregularis]|nr:unnamed protein product [Rhizophagus irregularis]